MKSSEVVMEKIDPNVYTREKERKQKFSVTSLLFLDN